MFDHTLDNMSLHEENGGAVSELLREKGMSASRSRLISDESFFHCFTTPFGDTPDKSFDQEEEYKYATPAYESPRRESTKAPTELLGIPLDDDPDLSSDTYQERQE